MKILIILKIIIIIFLNKFNINTETVIYDKLLEVYNDINYLYFIMKDNISNSHNQFYDKKDKLNIKYIENDIKKVSYIYYKIDCFLNDLVYVVNRYIKYNNNNKNDKNYKDN